MSRVSLIHITLLNDYIVNFGQIGRYIYIYIRLNTYLASNSSGRVGNFPFNWPKLLGPFQNIFITFFYVYVFGIISGTKKSDIIF